TRPTCPGLHGPDRAALVRHRQELLPAVGVGAGAAPRPGPSLPELSCAARAGDAPPGPAPQPRRPRQLPSPPPPRPPGAVARPHRDAWRQLSAAQRQARGMPDPRDVLVRALVCADCHVGRGDADVNHDLIEAGHPRLRFEYAAYLARYPRHWRLADDRRRYPDFDARAWEVGQLASSAAALELLSHRAGRRGPWPELAEYTCASCHHELEESGRRRERSALERRRATPPWGTWYHSLLPVLARTSAEHESLPALAQLRQLMARRRPQRKLVADAA